MGKEENNIGQDQQPAPHPAVSFARVFPAEPASLPDEGSVRSVEVSLSDAVGVPYSGAMHGRLPQ